MSICDAPIISTVCTAVGEGPAGLFFSWVADAMGLAVSTLFQGMWEVFSTTTAVDVTSDGYLRVYNVLFGIAVFVTLLLFCLQLVTGLARRDPSALARAGVGVAKSVLGSFVLITLTALLMQVTDLLSVGIIQAAGETIESMGGRIALLTAGLTVAGSTSGAGALLMIFLAGLMIAAIFILWFSLLIRKALLLVAIVLGPIALAGLTWEASRGWFGKWATFVVALIASKLVVTVIFLVALTQLATPITLDLAVLSEPVAGIVLLFVAAFAPYMVYKFLSFVGFDMYQASSMEQEAKSALNRPIPIPSKPNTGQAKQVLDGAGSKGNPAASEPAPAPTTAPAAPAEGAVAGGGSVAGGAGGGGAAAGGAAAAGPVVAGAMIVKEAVETAATAGPALGSAVGEVADGHAAAAGETSAPSSTAQAQQPPAVLPPPDTRPSSTGSEG